MTPAEFQSEARRLFGDGTALGVIREVAAALGVSWQAVRKWWYGERPVPDHVEVTLGLMRQKKH